MAAHSTRQLKSAKFCALLNGAYHADREAHLDWWHRLFMFLVIILGASAIVDTLADWARITASVSTAALGAADLVLDLSVRARTASFLRENYFDIAADIESGKLSPLEASAAMLVLSGKEEPPYKAAHAIAENWAHRAVYGDRPPLPCRIVGWRRVMRNVLRQSGHDFAC